MTWPDEISIGLPPERSDEPADLRRDIVDELADHLGCAMKRELRKTGDEASARRAVLARFGDPARIASRLWFDAMEEQIMSQRITLITNLALAAACIVIAITAFAAMRQNAQISAALIEKIETMGAGGNATAAPSVWSDAKVRIVRDSIDGEPCVDFPVRLRGEMFNPGKSDEFHARTDAEGYVSFGPMRPGRYSLRITEHDRLFGTHDVVFFPGEDEADPIVWPTWASVPARISIDLEMPEALRDEVAYFVCRFEPTVDDLDEVEGTWQRDPLHVLLAPTGEAMAFGDPGPVEFIGRGPGPRTVRLNRDVLRLDDRVEVDSTIEYRLKSITACLLMGDPADPDALEELTWQVAGQIVGTVGEPRTGTRRFRVPEYVNNTIYRAEPGQESEWAFQMPGEFEIAIAKWTAERERIENEAAASDEAGP